MKDQIVQGAQHAASGKLALTLGIGGITSPAWLDVLQSDVFRGIAVIMGIFVAATVIMINIQNFRQKLMVNKEIQRQEQIKTALLEREAKEKNIVVEQ